MKFPAPSSPLSRRRRGLALVIVLWIILILSMASIAAIRLVISETDQTINRNQGARARLIANMGVSVAANPAVYRDEPLLKQSNDGEGYEATFTSEAAKFNINYMILRKDNDLLRNIFIKWGLNFDEANDLIAALYDWSDEDDELQTTGNGAEKNEYEKMGFKNFPFNRPFYSLSELRYVRGWKRVEELKPDWRDWFTIWSQGKLDVNEAEPELLALACNLDIDNVRRIREEVVGPDQLLGTSDDARKTNLSEVLDSLGVPRVGREQFTNRLTVQDSTTRIESIGTAGDQKRKLVVIIANRTGVPTLLDRYEEIVP